MAADYRITPIPSQLSQQIGHVLDTITADSERGDDDFAYRVRRLVEQGYAAGYDDGHRNGATEARTDTYRDRKAGPGPDAFDRLAQWIHDQEAGAEDGPWSELTTPERHPWLVRAEDAVQWMTKDQPPAGYKAASTRPTDRGSIAAQLAFAVVVAAGLVFAILATTYGITHP